MWVEAKSPDGNDNSDDSPVSDHVAFEEGRCTDAISHSPGHSGGNRPSSQASHSRSRADTPNSQFPSSADSSITSTRAGRERRQRVFSRDELNCFKRVCTPTSEWDNSKSEAYWQSTGAFRRIAGDQGLHMLPVLKSSFFHPPASRERVPSSGAASCDEEQVLAAALGHKSPSRANARRRATGSSSCPDFKDQPLPIEEQTARVLDVIYPLRRQASDTSSTVGEANGAFTSSGDVHGALGGADDDQDPQAKSYRIAGSVSFAVGDVNGSAPLGSKRARPAGLKISVQESSPRDGPFNEPVSPSHPSRNATTPGHRASVSFARDEALDLSPKAVLMAQSSPTRKSSSLSTSTGKSLMTSSRSPGSVSTPNLSPPTPSTPSRRKTPKTPSSGMRIGIGSPSASGAAESDQPVDPRRSPQGAMLNFRHRLMDKFGTVAAAFARFARDPIAANAPDLSKKDWKSLLANHGFEWDGRKEERDAMLSNMDFTKDRQVSINEFHIAVEASAPVRTLMDLRRRWLASGYPSMMQAIKVMDEDGAVTRGRLNLREFGERLDRVRVHDQAEHAALFALITSESTDGRCSIGELACAVATVSPTLLLEDVRWRLLERCKGELWRAYHEMDPDYDGCITKKDFLLHAVYKLHLPQAEAIKFFHSLDINGEGFITRTAFVSFLDVCEPSLYLEDLRLKVRQRWRTIEETLREAFKIEMAVDPDHVPVLSLKRFQELLRQCEIKEDEAKTLFLLLDANRDDSVTLREVSCGIRKFAPSFALDKLRLLCLARHPRVTDTFENMNLDLLATLDFTAFEQTLKDVSLDACDYAKDIFDLLDVKHDGIITIGRLLVALQSGGPGCVPRLLPDDRDQKAKQDMLAMLSPMRVMCAGLKESVRKGTCWDEEREKKVEAGGGSMDYAAQQSKVDDFFKYVPGEPPPPPIRWPQVEAAGIFGHNGTDEATEPEISSPVKFRTPYIKTMQHEMLQMGPLVQPMNPRASLRPTQKAYAGANAHFGKVWHNLSDSPGHEMRHKMKSEMQNYFQQAAWHLSHDVPLQLGTAQSYLNNHVSLKAHNDALKPKRAKSTRHDA